MTFFQCLIMFQNVADLENTYSSNIQHSIQQNNPVIVKKEMILVSLAVQSTYSFVFRIIIN